MFCYPCFIDKETCRQRQVKPVFRCTWFMSNRLWVKPQIYLKPELLTTVQKLNASWISIKTTFTLWLRCSGVASPKRDPLNWAVSMGRERIGTLLSLEKRQESGERDPCHFEFADFTSVTSFCGVRKEGKKRIAFLKFLFLHDFWTFLMLTFLECQRTFKCP